MTAALVLALASTVGTLAVPWAVKELIARISDGGSLVGPVSIMAGFALGGAVASAVSAYLLERIGEGMIFRLRSEAMAHGLRLPLRTIRAEGSGTLVARITSDAVLLRSVVDVGVVQLPVAAATVLLTLGVMAYLDWVLAALTVGVFTLVGLAVGWVVVRVRRNLMAQQTFLGVLSQRFTAALGSLTTIKAYRAEERTAEQLSGDAAVLREKALKGARLQSLLSPVLGLGQQAALVSVIVVGGARITSGDLGIAEFAGFLLYLMQLVGPVMLMVTGVNRLQSGLAARDRFTSLLTLPAEEDAVASVGRAILPGPALELNGVHFGYGGDPVLRGVSFTVQRTGLTAVVGHSGAGKTTVLSLVERFLEPDSGRVAVLGREVRHWPLGALRERIAFTDQAFTLLEGTVRENLTLGRSDTAPDDELWAALAAVGLREDVAALADGLDTELGRATDLSGGQRQRLALARVVLSSAPLVLLDEPTSQLDSVNEQRLRDVMTRVAREQAVVVVAHRLSTVQHADQVVVMDHGRVVDAGRHAELMARCGVYRELVHSQAWVA
ncbi:ABC transporter ATP-binding protein [Streptomyces sp. QH1-20]|uniref:ABC transporter ATP-binding protein n=1 Tax=Streptomyces sp. QH1-20 TaxID=3240934 RepID=UPI0035191620